MKRSEMIQQLNEFIVDKSGDFDGDEILEFIEEAGMLPPKRIWAYDVTKLQGLTYDQKGNIITELKKPKYDNEWDLEY